MVFLKIKLEYFSKTKKRKGKNKKVYDIEIIDFVRSEMFVSQNSIKEIFKIKLK